MRKSEIRQMMILVEFPHEWCHASCEKYPFVRKLHDVKLVYDESLYAFCCCCWFAGSMYINLNDEMMFYMDVWCAIKKQSLDYCFHYLKIVFSTFLNTIFTLVIVLSQNYSYFLLLCICCITTYVCKIYVYKKKEFLVQKNVYLLQGNFLDFKLKTKIFWGETKILAAIVFFSVYTFIYLVILNLF